jgi:hypothetical protein
MNGKGSARRPMAITRKEFENNWDTVFKKHICKPLDPYCVCSIVALEPDEQCPIHGVEYPKRCKCGRFVKRK